MQSLIFRTTIYFVAEVLLTVLGTDDLADYGEYVFKVKDSLPSHAVTLVAQS